MTIKLNSYKLLSNNKMVADVFRSKSSSGLHPSYHFFGHEFVVDLPIQTIILSAIGSLFLLGKAFSLLRLILEILIIPGKNIKSYKSKKGDTWALVTGCTSGIGHEFATQLAAKGYNLILVGRRPEVLGQVAGELESKSGIKTKTVSADLVKPEARKIAFTELEKLSRELDLGVLVNNVGMSHEMPVPFIETDELEMEEIIQTNIMATLFLTRAVLPAMVARSSKKGASRSLILNVGSLSGRIPSPWLATYSCTKGGLQTWTQALGEEVKAQGVDVLMVAPAFVATKMSKIRKATLLAPTAKTYVSTTLSKLGLPLGAQGRPYQMTPYWTHAFTDYIISSFGYLSENAAIKVVFGMHKDIRKRALKKKAREAKKE